MSRAETGHNKQTGKAALLQVGTYSGLITGIDCLCKDKGLKWDECDCVGCTVHNGTEDTRKYSGLCFNRTSPLQNLQPLFNQK